MGVERVLLVRHGETDYNVQRRWQGQLDTPLNQTGQNQAAALARALQEVRIDAIFSSDLSRAMDTAAILAASHGLPVTTEPRLREIHVGIFQGLNRLEINERYPWEMHRWTSDDAYTPKGGESRVQLQARVYAAWQDITQCECRTVLLVSHGGTIRLLLKKVVPDAQVDGLRFANTSLTILVRRPDAGWVVERVADAAHL